MRASIFMGSVSTRSWTFLTGGRADGRKLELMMSPTKTASSGCPAALISTSYVDGRRRSISPKMSSPTHTGRNGVEYSFQKCAAMPRNGPRARSRPTLKPEHQVPDHPRGWNWQDATGVKLWEASGRKTDQSDTALVALNMTRPKEWRLSLLPRSLGFPAAYRASRATFISSALEGFSLAAFRAAAASAAASSVALLAAFSAFAAALS